MFFTAKLGRPEKRRYPRCAVNKSETLGNGASRPTSALIGIDGASLRPAISQFSHLQPKAVRPQTLRPGLMTAGSGSPCWPPARLKQWKAQGPRRPPPAGGEEGLEDAAASAVATPGPSSATIRIRASSSSRVETFTSPAPACRLFSSKVASTSSTVVAGTATGTEPVRSTVISGRCCEHRRPLPRRERYRPTGPSLVGPCRRGRGITDCP